LTDSLPKISIITPSYQQADFLEQTITSVIEQEYPYLEYLVVDGGSTDGSVDLIKKYESKIDWWVSEKDQGQADAINKGLQKATGDIIGWINSDDYYLPGTFKSVVKVFAKNPQVGLVYGDVLAVDGSDKAINIMQYQPWDVSDLLQFRMIGQSSVFFRRSTLEKSGLLGQQYHYLLDHHLWLRMAVHDKMVYVPKIWSAARYHEGAKNLAGASHFGDDARQILKWASQDTMFKTLWEQYERKASAGAAWLDAFYLSDAGRYGASIKAYLKVLKISPARFFEDWKKFVYTLLCWLKIGFLTNRLESINRRNRQDALSKLIADSPLRKYVE
jgi:glycosyltransferase involved in cell wall biosynthesis